MPKNVFWPATLVTMGFIFLASNLGLLPAAFWNFWPLILIIVGLGGLLTSDREEWLINTDKKSPKVKKNSTRKKSSPKKPAQKTKTASRKKKPATKKKK